MLTQTIYLTLALVLTSFLPSFAGAETLTGQQCRNHLTPITQYVVNRSMAPQFNEINGEIPNMMGKPLSEIVETKGQSRLVQFFVLQAVNTIEQCERNCSGIRNRDGNLVNCADISKMSIINIHHKIGLIDENAIAEVNFVPNPECAFNPSAENCKQIVEVNQEDSSDPVVEEDSQITYGPSTRPVIRQSGDPEADPVAPAPYRNYHHNRRADPIYHTNGTAI